MAGTGILARLIFPLLAAACGPALPFAPVPPPAGAFAWRTMRSEQSTLVTARTREGKVVSRRVRGVIAAERPDRLRLRALGPGGVTLFDLLDRDGRCVIVSSYHGAAAQPHRPLHAILGSLCHDLRAAYRLGSLEPRARRRILYSDWRRVGASWEPFRLLIEDPAAGFTADVTVERTVLDQPLDPALFDLH